MNMSTNNTPQLLPGEVTHPSYAWRPEHLISFGLPFEKLAKAHAERLNVKRILLIVSKTLSEKTKESQKLEEAFGDLIVFKRVGMTPHTLWTEIMEVTEAARKNKCDCIMTLGGGSLIDAAKLTRLIVHDERVHTDDLDTLKPFVAGGALGLADSRGIRPASIPFICIPTTVSGGEHSGFAGCVDPRNDTKWTFGHPSACPTVCILDGELCNTVPIDVWMSTGVRAIDHCVETMCRLISPDKQLDEDAREGLILLCRGMIRLSQDPNNAEERVNTLLGACLGMQVISKRIPFGGSHAIGHALGSLGVPHGVTSCIVLPATMKYNRPINASRQDACLAALYSDPTIASALEERNVYQNFTDLGDVLDTLFRIYGVPRSLKEIDFWSEEQLERTAERTLIDVFCGGNPIELDKEKVMCILRKCV